MIPGFVDTYQVDMTGCDETYLSYKNFAEFFAREKKDISFPKEPGILGSPCEGVLSVYTDIDPENLIAAKGSYYSLGELFCDKSLAESYRGGMMLKIRLAPADYHRVHFFDEGKIESIKNIDGDLFSVNPIAVSKIPHLYCRNKRALMLFSSKNFGDVAIVKVGATFVGSIVHCVKTGDYVKRGQLAGYFLPGGSLVLVFLKNGDYLPRMESKTRVDAESKTRVGEAL